MEEELEVQQLLGEAEEVLEEVEELLEEVRERAEEEEVKISCMLHFIM